MIQWTRQHLSSQTKGVMMMVLMMVILISPNTIYMVIQSTQSQTEHNSLNQGLHQHHTSQGDHIILMKSLKCPLYHKSRVEWHTPQESQHGMHLLIYIQMQVLQIWMPL